MASNSPPRLGRETYWFDRREFLLHQGYRLRPKFDPDFASRYQTLDETAQEESQRHTIMDAVRTWDDTKVLLKSVSTSLHPHEVEIAQMFSSPPHLGHPRNHCVPLLELLPDPEDSDKQISVMPQLVTCQRPVFETVGEVMACWRDIFEGIQYMHENLVAHRDCTFNNIMQGPTLLYPEGFYPVQTWMDPSYKHFARHITRTEYPAHGPPTEEVICGGDKSPPEHLGAAYDIPCNPFQPDIYFLGNLLKRQFMYKAFPLSTHIRLRLYGPLSFLDPLIEDMTQRDPALRPTSGEVIERLDEITRKLGSWHLRRPGQRFYLLDWPAQLVRQIKNLFKRVPVLPPYTPLTILTLSPEMRMFYTQTSMK
ncbi:kinase domain-containing protein [Favolaschia claudopus]|uniref:Kinase domain-containing protein n=1 Tax=Favolaschia claudopus TaxID=2862362 RepID=A0AAW0BMI7_9AGAR